MTRIEIQDYRLFNQNISDSVFSSPQDLVHWLVGIQSQDYMNAKWSIGVRVPEIKDDIIEASILNNSIIRTWLLRGTIHFIEKSDINWLLKLLAAGLLHSGKSRNKQLGLDEKILKFSLKLLDSILKDGNAHTREEIKNGFSIKGMEIDGILLSHILQYSALNGQTCFGPKHGSHFTYKLFNYTTDNRQLLTREEALYELAFRYFRSYGPATIHDFTWWSGLSAKDARNALENVKSKLICDVFKENQYWMMSNSLIKLRQKTVYLLPAFDSYLLAYRNRSIYLDDINNSKVISENGVFRPIIVYNGKIIGIWKRTFKKEQLTIDATIFISMNNVVKKGILECAEQFAIYCNKYLSKLTINNTIL
jgi:Winged helix DNA-binding domain